MLSYKSRLELITLRKKFQIRTFEASVRAAPGGDGEGQRRSALHQNLHAVDGTCEEDPRPTRSTSEGERAERSDARCAAWTSEGRNLLAHAIRFASDPLTRRRLSVRAGPHQCEVHLPDGPNTRYSHTQHDAFAEACKSAEKVSTLFSYALRSRIACSLIFSWVKVLQAILNLLLS